MYPYLDFQYLISKSGAEDGFLRENNFLENTNFWMLLYNIIKFTAAREIQITLYMIQMYWRQRYSISVIWKYACGCIHV